MPKVRRMQADLVPPPGRDPDGHQTERLYAVMCVGQHLQPRRGWPPARHAHRARKPPVLPPEDPSADLPAARWKPTVAEDNVVTLDHTGVKLEFQVSPRSIGLRSEDDARARHVQTVQHPALLLAVTHNVPPPGGVCRLQMPGELGDPAGSWLAAITVVHLPADGLVDDHPVWKVQESDRLSTGPLQRNTWGESCHAGIVLHVVRQC
mmetsp:Transcript_6834/g.21078  ORF Transcript_6834/g.21078 Transcript_6834/m.21078 type:complete len:207 (+) Transcript_6834:187-807(+)